MTNNTTGHRHKFRRGGGKFYGVIKELAKQISDKGYLLKIRDLTQQLKL